MNPKIQFVLCDRVKDYYGITSGLYNSATFVADFLRKEGYDTRLDSIKDSNFIDKVVTEYDPQVVIIEALWVPPQKFEELFKIQRHRKRTWIVRLHSKAPFLANEGIATKWIREYANFKHPRILIAPNTSELTEQLHSAFPKGYFITLPNVYKFKEFKRSIFPKEDNWIDIGCFGAIRPMKNNYQQALAAIAFSEAKGKRLRFHINSTRVEQKGDNVLKNLKYLFEGSRHKLVEHYWYKHNDFLKVISKMDVGMQVSFSESFNIVSADFVTAGVPIVVSDDIEWMPGFSKVSPTSHEGMVRGLKRLTKFGKIASFIQKIYLKAYNIKAKIYWLSALKTTLKK